MITSALTLLTPGTPQSRYQLFRGGGGETKLFLRRKQNSDSAVVQPLAKLQ